MIYYEFDTVAAAKEANMRIMDANSNQSRSDRVTLFAYAMHEHPTNGRAILAVDKEMPHGGEELKKARAMSAEQAARSGYYTDGDQMLTDG